jgi:glycosyltransferase involved in cell wall biosynthesis
MKRFGIDARLYNQTGVGTYVRNLLTYLPDAFKKQVELYVYVMEQDAAQVRKDLPGHVIRPGMYRWHSLEEQSGFLYQLNRDKLDGMHFTYFSYPVLYHRPFIATVHDLTPLYFKTGKASTRNPLKYALKFHAFQFVLSQQIARAEHVITPTQTVKQQVMERFPHRSASSITVTYEGVDVAFTKIKPNKEMAKEITNPFFVYVGNFYPHKNVSTLIRAFAHVPEPYELVLAGPEDFFAARIRAEIAEAALMERVRFVSKPEREDLAWLYANATALVHPSFSEGFGLPLVEAMQFDTPIVASDIPVFRELLRTQYTWFDPRSEKSIAQAIKQCIQEKPLPDYSNLKQYYSFQTMAEQTAVLYQSLLGL